MSEISYSPAFTDQIGSAVHQNSALSTTGLLERIFAWLFEGLVYPQIWEDPVADMVALDLCPEDRMVCIASGGCNVMSYLTAHPRSITAVDLSPAHVALLKLKIAAAFTLPDHSSFYAFFGRADCKGNAAVYDRLIAPALDAETRRYWETRPYGRRRIAMFERGFYRFGLLGRFIAAVHLIARFGGVDFRPLLSARTLDEQRTFFDTRIAPLYDKPLIRFLARRRASLFGLGIPPAQYEKLAADAGGDVIPVLRERTRKLICDFPISDNYFAWQAFHRGYAEAENRAVPPYLAPENFAGLRDAASRVRVTNRSLTDLLAAEKAASRDCYVLLDAQDWMTDAQLNALWEQITRTAAPGARVLFRTGGAADILPGRVSAATLARWDYDVERSKAALATDRSAIYGGVHLYRLKA